MSDPVLVAVDEDAVDLADVERELRDRYGRHYRVECFGSSREALDRLKQIGTPSRESDKDQPSKR